MVTPIRAVNAGLASVLTTAFALSVGCAHRVALEGGEKPIKIDMTVTLKVDRELDEFFAFQHKYDGPTTNPATPAVPATPATQPGVVNPATP